MSLTHKNAHRFYFHIIFSAIVINFVKIREQNEFLEVHSYFNKTCFTLKNFNKLNHRKITCAILIKTNRDKKLFMDLLRSSRFLNFKSHKLLRVFLKNANENFINLKS